MTKKRATNKKRVTDKKGTEDFHTKVGSIITFISTILTVVSLVLTMVNSYRSYSYAEKATKFYGIPKYYFLEKNTTNIISNILFFGAILFILCLPILFLKREGKSKISKGVAWMFSIEVGIISMLLFYYFISVQIFSLDFIINCNIPKIKWLVVGLFMLIFFIVYIFIIRYYFKNNFEFINYKKITSSEGTEHDKKTGSFNAYIIFSIIIVILCFYFIYDTDVIVPENKTVYEIATLKDGSQRVLVCHYKDKVILMDFALLFSNSNELPSLDFSKGNYSVEPVEGIKFKLRKFKSACNKFL